MYNLFGRVLNGITAIKDVMTCHIHETGKQLVADPERFKGPVDFVQRLLDEKDKYDNIISLFVDDKLRKAELVIEEDDRVIVLDKVVILVFYLEDKGIFKKYIKHQLAERLFLGSPRVSEEIETLFTEVKN